VGTHDAAPERIRWMRALACRAYWTALEGRPGVVHLNFALREPLVSEQELPADTGGRPDGQPWLRREAAAAVSTATQERFAELVGGARRGLLVVGRDERERRPESLGAAAATFGATATWPVLADPLSRGRRGLAAIAHYDLLLRSPAVAQALAPDLVVRVGDLPTSKPLRGWLASLGDARQVALDPEAAWQDPASVVGEWLALDPALALARARDRDRAHPEPDWLERWQSADAHVAAAVEAALQGSGLSEPAVARELGSLLPEHATLFVASSMPVRDVEAFWPAREDPPRVLCNRGANGIDGTVSSAFGAAAHGDGPVVLLIGDVALAHDMGALICARRLGLAVTIVLLNNGGGSIFDFLPVARAPLALEQGRYERHIATPPELDFAAAAALYGLAHERVTDLVSFRSALRRALGGGGASIVEVPGAREANRALHERLWRQAQELSPPAAEAARRA
jgi:2-succinyl-5-enolpyruvyl-6-hydroxy-3-cyclohexene-1-carboxylate synthase